MMGRSAAVFVAPSFVTVQVRAVQVSAGGDGPDDRRQNAASALFFDLATRTVRAYVLDDCGHTHPTGALRRVRGGLSAAHLQLAKTMLSVRDHDSVTLAALGEACGLSPSHFAREFKQSTGLPPHRWALKNKVALAKDLLRQGGLALPAIALACGFVDQSHLGRWFKRLTGISPRAWQRLHLDSVAIPARAVAPGGQVL